MMSLAELSPEHLDVERRRDEYTRSALQEMFDSEDLSPLVMVRLVDARVLPFDVNYQDFWDIRGHWVVRATNGETRTFPHTVDGFREGCLWAMGIMARTA